MVLLREPGGGGGGGGRIVELPKKIIPKFTTNFIMASNGIADMSFPTSLPVSTPGGSITQELPL